MRAYTRAYVAPVVSPVSPPTQPSTPSTSVTPAQPTFTVTATTDVAHVAKQDGAPLYSDRATTMAIGRILAAESDWQAFQKVVDTNGAIVAYNQFVKASDVTVSNAATPSEKGIFTVRYPTNPKWSIAVYDAGLQVKKLIPARSQWQTFGTKTIANGHSYYNLSGNQWVRTDYGFWTEK